MNSINWGDLNLSPEESRDIIEFIAQKRNVNNYKDKSNNELLSAIKEKCRILTPKKPLKNSECKNDQNLTPEKPPKKPERKNNQILTSEKPLKNSERKNNRILTSKNKERIGIIREELRELPYKPSQSELKEIKRRLYMVENKKGLLNSKKNSKCLDELDEKIRKLYRYYHDYDDFEYRGIKNIEDLFRLSISEDYYKPKLVKTGYSGNYDKYESKGDKILTAKE